MLIYHVASVFQTPEVLSSTRKAKGNATQLHRRHKAESAELNKRHLSVVADDNELASHVTPAALAFSDHLFCGGSQDGLLDTQASTVPPSHVDTQASTRVDSQASTQPGGWTAFDRNIRNSESLCSLHAPNLLMRLSHALLSPF